MVDEEKFVIVTTDDLCPSFLNLWGNYWDVLKERHPDLKVTSFTVPLWGGSKVNDVYRSESFKDWFEGRKGWVEVAMHGFRHSKPPEGQHFRKRQYSFFIKGFRKIRCFVDLGCVGFKAPFYRLNEHTFSVLKELGFGYLVHWNTVFLFKPLKSVLPVFKVISSHTNGEEFNVDNIDRIFGRLDVELTLLEKQGFKYATFRDLIKPRLEVKK